MQAVTLKNGTQEPSVLVASTMMSLKGVMEQNPIAIYELTMKCRDSNHRFFGNSGSVLAKFSLVQSDGSIHDSIRNVVLSAVQGDGLDMTIGSPIKQSVHQKA